MKTIRFIAIALSVICLGFGACKKDNEPNVETFKIVKEVEKVVAGTTTATITGTYEFSGRINNIKVRLGTSEQLFGSDIYEAEVNGKAYSVSVTDLTPGTLYHYRYEVDFGASSDFLTEVYSFSTQSESPSVKATDITAIDSTTYRVKCEVVSDGGAEVTERGICWNTYGDPTLDDETLQHASGGLGQYTIRMENLALGKRYYVRAYAKNAADKIGYSEEVDFETDAPAGLPVEIELSCNPAEGGTVSGGGTYEAGTQCTVTATANTGYTFVNWTENGSQVSSEATYTFAVTTGRSLVANFTKQAYVITTDVDPDDSGTVTGAGGYDYGEQCTLTATPKTGYDFQKWTKGGATVSTEAEYTFTVNASATYVAHFKVKSYTVTVSANPGNGGTVTGGGSVNYGQSCTVHATANSGYAFASWTDEGDEVSTDADYTFTVTGNRSLKANFTELQPDEYSIQVSANPTAGGTVSGGGTYQQGRQCTVRATSSQGYTFINWTEDGTQVSDLAEYAFTVSQNRTLVANFEAQAPNEYTISVSANPSNGGTVTGGGTYQQSQQCTVSAQANEGYTFTNWTEDGEEVSTSSSITFLVGSDRTLVANFTIKSYTINASANPANGGSVTGGGTYNHGQSCTLSATAANGYSFTNWTENGNEVSTDPNYTFTVTGNRTLVAHFAVQAPNTYSINVSANPGEGGTVSGGGTCQQGQSCTVTASANTGYTFLKWTENGIQVSTDASYTFTVNGNRTLVAQFQVKSYTISASADPSNGGMVTGNGTYNHGASCTLTATPSAGYTFVKWTKDGTQVSTDASYTFTVTETASYVAHFQLKSYTVSTSANPSAGGTVTGGGTYDHGQSCTVRATASTGYTFLRWTENGTQVSTNANYTFTVTSNRTLVAQFQQQTYTINVSANPTAGGTATVSGNGTFTYGQSCTVTATPANGYTFANWTEGGTVVQGAGASYTFTVTGNRTLKANFTQQSYTINVSANPTAGGTAHVGSTTGSTSGSYNNGQSCTVYAIANSGYIFTNWTEGSSVVSSNATYSFTVNGNRTLKAIFTQQITHPTVTTSQITDITSTDAMGGGNVTDSGGSMIIQKGICWSTSHNPTIDGSHTSCGVDVGPYTCGLLNLSPNTKYYVRAYAVNAHYTGYGNEVSFTTAAASNYTISVSANPNAGGTVSGGGTYTYGQSCAVHAYANSGYTFTNWTVGGSQVATTASYTFQVTGNRTLVANFTYNGGGNVPQGAIDGLFTINSNGDQVYFSKGNLQYKASTNTWQFAANQYDYIGSANSNVSSSYSGWIDLFGWGTSGYNHGAVCYQPWSTSQTNSDYFAYDSDTYNLYDQTGKADWGYNAISNGGNTTNTWRTLTKDEWVYVFNTRSTTSEIRYAKACVNNVTGVILLPDDWSANYYSLNSANAIGASFSSNTITLSQWNILEQHGAVFLPAAGYRYGASVSGVGSRGSYWSASYCSSGSAYSVYFVDSLLSPQDNGSRYYGFSVRLVRVAQ